MAGTFVTEKSGTLNCIIKVPAGTRDSRNEYYATPAMEPPRETPSCTQVQNPCHQLTYTEPRTHDASSPPDVATGPPCAGETVVPSPTVESTPTLPRRSSRIRHAPEWQRDFVCE